MGGKGILVTGGVGYIGSHTLLELLQAGRGFVFHRKDVRDREGLARFFDAERINAVIHVAGLKAAEESTRLPLDGHQNNLGGRPSTARFQSGSDSCRLRGPGSGQPPRLHHAHTLPNPIHKQGSTEGAGAAGAASER